ncbi:hypothetical protein BGX21_005943, partial [Mortierella sp. AD011]
TIGTPEYITTDDAQTEYSAIRKAFGESVTVHLCLWHIIRAWSNKFRSLIRAADGKTGKELREEALAELRTILYDPYLDRALRRIESFKAKWKDHNDSKVLDYLEKRYFTEDRRKRWMKAYRMRKFYAGMDTNNYVESWHNHLKSHFLRGHSNCRGDRLIYILSRDVDEFYQLRALQSVRRYGRHTKGERDDFMQMKFLDGKSMDELKSMVAYVEPHEGVYFITSFSKSGGYYFVHVENNVIMKCCCHYFMYSGRPCRHMFLLNKVYENDLDTPLRIVHQTIDRVPEKHAVIGFEQSTLDQDVDFVSNETREEDASYDEDEVARGIDELVESLRKGLHSSDSLVKSREVYRRLSKIVEEYHALPSTCCTSGTKKRQRQQY